MANDTFELEVATPAVLALRATVRDAQIPASTGYFGVLPGHAPLIAELGTGVLSYHDAQGGTGSMVVSGGFLEVRPDKAVLLADLAESAEHVNVSNARSDLENAERMERGVDPDTNYDEARRMVQLAEARLELANLQPRKT